jgi:putative endonuclease
MVPKRATANGAATPARTTVPTKPSAKDQLGAYGEELAAQWLQAAGMAVLDRNWRCREGELDIVARDGDTIVFCEVKSRSSARFGRPIEAITPAKARRQRALAARWLAAHRDEVTAASVRFDAVGVLTVAGCPPAVTHLTAVL